MTDRIIGAGPFDPHANARITRRGRLRGIRLLMFLLGAATVGAGFFLFNAYVGSWRWEKAEAAIEVKPSKAKLPMFEIEQATLPTPVADKPLPPKLVLEEEKKAPPIKRQPPARQGFAAKSAEAELPSQITWNVQVAGEPKMDWFSDGRRPMLAKGCALRPGASLIPAVLNSVVQSEVPGQVIATVSEDVMDVDGVGRLLIPQGSKLVGIYSDNLNFQSRRLGIVWTELVKPDGSQLTLGEAPGLDIAGSMGLGGEVTTAWGEIIAVATVFSIFEAAQRATVPDDDYASQIADATVNQFSRTGQQVVKKMLDQAVKIRIPAGTPITVSVSRTIQVC